MLGVMTLLTASSVGMADIRPLLRQQGFDAPINGRETIRYVGHIPQGRNDYQIYLYRGVFRPHAGDVDHGVNRLVVILNGRTLVGTYNSSMPTKCRVRGRRVICNTEGRPSVIEFSGGASARAISILPLGLADTGAAATALSYSAESCRPPSPVHLAASIISGQLRLSWVRRSRLGWDWPDDVEVPLGEQAEIYRVTVQGAYQELTLDASESAIDFSAAQVASLGSGPVFVSIRQVGDRALSRPATCTIIIP